MQTSGCLPAPSGMAAMANERCTMAGATTTLCSSVRGGTSLCILGVARHCAHGADLCRGASRHHSVRRLAQAARVEDTYGGHGVGVEQNGSLAQAARVEDAYGGHGVGVEQNGRPDEHT